jgi:hypothetical protein
MIVPVIVSVGVGVRMGVPGPVGMDVFPAGIVARVGVGDDQLHRLGRRRLEGLHAEPFHIPAATIEAHDTFSR